MLEVQVAFVLGALHALEPGHGKTAMTTYMLNGSRKWTDSLMMAVSAGFSHTAIIIFLAIAAHIGSHVMLKDGHQISGPLEHLSGFLMIIIGLYLIFTKAQEHKRCCGHHHHGHEPENHHHHKKDLKTSAFFGLSLGLFPCPSLLAAFTLALNSGHTELGIMSAALFTLGMVLSLFLCGQAFRWLGKKSMESFKLPLSLKWRSIQGAIICIIGLYYAIG